MPTITTRTGPVEVDAFRAIRRHENCDVERSPIFDTVEGARAWASANLDRTPKASKSMQKWARATQTPISECLTTEHVAIKARKVGGKNFLISVEGVHVDHVIS